MPGGLFRPLIVPSCRRRPSRRIYTWTRCVQRRRSLQSAVPPPRKLATTERAEGFFNRFLHSLRRYRGNNGVPAIIATARDKGGRLYGVGREGRTASEEGSAISRTTSPFTSPTDGH